MTDLKRPVKRNTAGLVREAGKVREVVVTLAPPNLIGFRAKGCRKTYWLTSEVCYQMAVKAHVLDERRQKRTNRKRPPHRKG